MRALLMRKILSSVGELCAEGCTDEIILERLQKWYNRNANTACGGFLYWMMTNTELSSDPPFWWIYKSNTPTCYVHLHDGQVGNNQHYALFLPEINLYLSQYGKDGAVILSDITDMTEFFETTDMDFVSALQPCWG